MAGLLRQYSWGSSGHNPGNSNDLQEVSGPKFTKGRECSLGLRWRVRAARAWVYALYIIAILSLMPAAWTLSTR